MKDLSTKHISNDLLEEIFEALRNIRGFGSVEIIVQNNKVVQITERNIKKTIGLDASDLLDKVRS
jgi:hypothetical protein